MVDFNLVALAITLVLLMPVVTLLGFALLVMFIAGCFDDTYRD